MKRKAEVTHESQKGQKKPQKSPLAAVLKTPNITAGRFFQVLKSPADFENLMAVSKQCKTAVETYQEKESNDPGIFEKKLLAFSEFLEKIKIEDIKPDEDAERNELREKLRSDIESCAGYYVTKIIRDSIRHDVLIKCISPRIKEFNDVLNEESKIKPLVQHCFILFYNNNNDAFNAQYWRFKEVCFYWADSYGNDSMDNFQFTTFQDCIFHTVMFASLEYEGLNILKGATFRNIGFDDQGDEEKDIGTFFENIEALFKMDPNMTFKMDCEANDINQISKMLNKIKDGMAFENQKKKSSELEARIAGLEAENKVLRGGDDDNKNNNQQESEMSNMKL